MLPAILKSMKQGGYREASMLVPSAAMPAARSIRSSFVKTPWDPRGFTMVEVMVVLAVTSVMAISALAFINGRQNRTQFTMAINTLQQQIQQVINETTNGYYPQTTAFSCSRGTPSAPPTLTAQAAGDHQGQNPDCIFLGKVMQFGVAGSNPQKYNVIPIIANRLDPTGLAEAATLYDVTTGSFPEAAAKTVGAPNSGITGADATTPLTQGLTVVKMWHDADIAANATGTVGFLSTLPSADGAGVASGSQHLTLYTVAGTTLNQSPQQAATAIYPSVTSTQPLTPVSSINICVASGSTNQSGLFTIGQSDNSASSALAVTLTIKAGTAC
jgi:prepilin-type N-terminal cleavage/methylation domain-containing protein